MLVSSNLYVIYQPLDETPFPTTTHLLGAGKVRNVVAVLHDDDFDDVLAVVVAQEAAALRLRCPLDGGCAFMHFGSRTLLRRKSAITGQMLGHPGGWLNAAKSVVSFDKEGPERAE